MASDPRKTMAGSVDFIKVDFERTTPAERTELVKRYGSPHCHMLAEKVEQFETALKAGFDSFQGYFFRRPEVLKAREIPTNQVNYLRMLQAVSRAEIDIRGLESIIKMEASVLYRLLCYLNSPLFGMRNEIHSIRHALAILDEREIRRWIWLVALVSAGQQKTSDLVLSALVRARFCEQLSRKIPRTQSDLFLVGMVSMMDAILNIPMTEVVEKIAIDHDTKCVLLGQAARLQTIYELMLAQEAGNWTSAQSFANQLRVSESELGELWWQAMQWARHVSSGKE